MAETISLTLPPSVWVCLILFAAVMAPTAHWMFRMWTASIWENGHSVFVPLIIAYFAYRRLTRSEGRRADSERGAEESSAWGLPVVMAGLLIVILDSAIHTKYLSAIGFVVDRREPTGLDRPWADSFEKAGERVVDPVPPNKVFGDWLADEVWSMRWSRFGSLARARVELATRLTIARRIAGWLDISTPKQDNISAAEAVMIADVIGTTDIWEKAQEAIPEP